MKTFMFNDPVGSGDRGPVVLVLVLERENLERMRQGDPADIQLKTMMQPGMSPRKFRHTEARDLDVVIAYEEDEAIITELMTMGGLPAVLAYLERGRQIKAGDCEPVRKL